MIKQTYLVDRDKILLQTPLDMVGTLSRMLGAGYTYTFNSLSGRNPY